MILRRIQNRGIFSLPILRSSKENPFNFKNSKASTFRMMSNSNQSWSCSVCTFINPSPSSSSSSSSQKPICQICLSPQLFSLSLPSFSFEKPNWSCKACTFLNSYDNTNCDVCGTRVSASILSCVEVDDAELDALGSGVGNVFFPLRACKNSCSSDGGGKNETRKVPEQNSVADSENFDHSCAGGFRGLKACMNNISISGNSGKTNKRKAMEENSVAETEDFDQSGAGGFMGLSASDMEVESNADKNIINKVLKVLSYNVWFREHLEMHKRMTAIGDLIELHSPDIICFQEVTPNIYDVLQQSSWWKLYSCSVSNEAAFTRGYFCMQLSKLPVKSYRCKSFANSIMGRELCIAEVDVQADTPLLVATTHLESPCPAPPKWDQMYSKERVLQAKYAIKLLEENPNAIFCGDMNWDDKLDGEFPLPDGWVDAWVQLRPSENGWTYDTKTNKMLTGNRTLQKRLDRFVCKLRDFKISEIQMIGVDEIPGLSYCKEKKVKAAIKKLILPVLPSDHYGLLLTISPQ